MSETENGKAGFTVMKTLYNKFHESVSIVKSAIQVEQVYQHMDTKPRSFVK
jgi:hypothetical protein